jgi:hypothetical protein
LHNFDVPQIEQLAHRYALSRSTTELQTLQQLIGGHPYLSRQSLYLLATSDLTFAQLVDHASSQHGPFGDHLRRLSSLVLQSESLRTALLHILNANSCEDEHSFQRLSAAGLVVGESRQQAQLRCRVYQDYFRNTL